MAITGRLLADFSSFYDACQRAEVSVRSFESNANRVEKSLNSMTDGFSGRRVIQEATLMAEAIERSGGVTKLTSSELTRAGSVAAEAAEKMKLLGIDVPPSIAKLATASQDLKAQQQSMLDTIGQSGGRMNALGTAASTTAPQVSGVTAAFRQFDGILASLGINVQRQVKGLEDVTNAALAGTSGFTKYAIGVGAAAAAFKTGWDFGRWIADITGADAAVAKLSQKLLGLGDVAAETAGAKLDTINRAIAMGARETINYKQAIDFIIEAQKRDADAKINWTQRLADAHKEVRNLSAAQKDEIAIAQEAGATTEQLTNKFKVSADALRILAAQHRDAAAAADEHRRKKEELNQAYSRLMSDVKNANQLAIMEADHARLTAETQERKLQSALKLRDAIYASAAASSAAARADSELAAEQARIDVENQKLIASYQATADAAAEGGNVTKAAAEGSARAFAGVAAQVTFTGDAIKEWIRLMQYSASVNAILSENSLFTTQSQRDRIANVRVPSFASGVENFSGGLARVHKDELLVNLAPGTNVIPRGSASGAGRSITINVAVHGSVVSTFEEFGNLVKSSLIGGLQQSGIPLPASA